MGGVRTAIGTTSVFIAWCAVGHAVLQERTVRFLNAAESSGVVFNHENGRTPDKYMPETMGGGGLIFDYDNDGWQDILLVNGGSFVDPNVAAAARHGLYRNNRDWTFTDVTDRSGLGVSGFGMGVCAADYDNDGWVDVYITSEGSNRLYQNDAGQGFLDATADAGVGTELWSASCAFGDIDNDGDVDLYVTSYVDFDAVDNNHYCGEVGQRLYCHPTVYNGLGDILYRNNGDGTFTDISREAGIVAYQGKGLGVVFGDYDNDGWTDIYVANDSVANFLFHNVGDGKFKEEALLAGVAVGGNGKPLAGMGTDMGDVNGDGLLDFFVTNLSQETHNLYQNSGSGFFHDVTARTGVAMATRPFVGFGTVFFDYDNDSDLDLAVANGDVLDNVTVAFPDRTYLQRNLLLQNDGTGTFKDVGPVSGPGFALEKVSRALAVGDLDNDGDLDILVVNNGQTADLLRNEGGNRGNALLIRTVGRESNRDGIGARVSLFDGDDRVSVRDVKAGSGYLGQSDLRVHLGLGTRSQADQVEVLWPSGTLDVLENVDANQIVTVTEGKGITGLEPFQRSH